MDRVVFARPQVSSSGRLSYLLSKTVYLLIVLYRRFLFLRPMLQKKIVYTLKSDSQIFFHIMNVYYNVAKEKASMCAAIDRCLL